MTSIPGWVPALIGTLVLALLGLAALWGRALSQLSDVRDSIKRMEAKLEVLIQHEEKLAGMERELARVNILLAQHTPHKVA